MNLTGTCRHISLCWCCNAACIPRSSVRAAGTCKVCYFPTKKKAQRLGALHRKETLKLNPWFCFKNKTQPNRLTKDWDRRPEQDWFNVGGDGGTLLVCQLISFYLHAAPPSDSNTRSSCCSFSFTLLSFLILLLFLKGVLTNPVF